MDAVTKSWIMVMCAAGLAAIVLFAIDANIARHRKRKRMTPEQRKAEDDETATDMQMW